MFNIVLNSMLGISRVKHLTSEPNTGSTQLLVHGQGVFLFSVHRPVELQILNQSRTTQIDIKLTDTNVKASIVRTMGHVHDLSDPNNKSGLLYQPGAYYWISLDSQNKQLIVGVGEPRMETHIYFYKFTEKDRVNLEDLNSIQYNKYVTPLRLLRDPITSSVPMKVCDTAHLTMEDVASGRVMPNANLSVISQKLYNCISGPNFVLDDPSFPEFSQAIERSIRTPGLWCYERLKQKSTEFNPGGKPNPLETYLRITLGQNNGESPGIPYVMEIWPVGHYSPVHSHSSANAVIRVLHGSIHVSLFPFLCATKSGVPPFAVATFDKGDITWISDTLNQTHQLRNLPTNQDTCITIQCYMYDEDDTQHYDYFDYIDENGKKQQYTPDSDMDFLTFKALMKREYLQQYV